MKFSRIILFTLFVTATAACQSYGQAVYGGTDTYGPPCYPESQGDGEGDGGGPEDKELGDPIWIPHGEYLDKYTDIYLPGRGLDIHFTRSYRSRTAIHALPEGDYLREQAVLGLGWSHNYDQWVAGIGGGRFAVFTGDERRIVLTQDSSYQGAGERYTADNFHGVLLVPDDDTESVTYTTEENTVYTYKALGLHYGIRGRLESIVDRNGNTITLTYGNTAFFRRQLASVSDGLGNELQLTYYDDINAPRPAGTILTNAEYGDLLWKVTDNSGREVEYKYDFGEMLSPSSDDLLVRHLSEVVLPATSSTGSFTNLPAEHSRFLNGRSIQYEYYADSFAFRGLLTKKIDQNGTVLLENYYVQPEADFQGDYARRIFKQDYAGDSYTYMITKPDGEADGATTTSDYAIWVQKRNGTIVEFQYTGSQGGADYHLKSRTDYPGEVPAFARDKVVWRDSSVNPPEWRYADDSFSSVGTVFLETEFVNKKRVSDLPVTKYFSFNDDWHMTRFEKPNGDVVEYVYDEQAGDARSRGAMLEAISKPASTIYDGDGIELNDHPDWISESYEYGFSFWHGTNASCSCSSGKYATAIIDGEGNRTEKVFDLLFEPSLFTPSGNLLEVYHDIPVGGTRINAAAVEKFTYATGGNLKTHTHPSTTRLVNGVPESFERKDEYDYYSDTHANIASRGKLHIQRIDKDGLMLVTEFEYDVIGNISKIIEPDGDVITRLHNQARQLVREQHWDASESTLYAQTDYFYDANGNLVIEKVKNLDEAQVLVAANPSITTVYEYNTRDFLTLRSIERGVVQNESITEDSAHRAIAPIGSDWVTQEWAYDENDNLILFRDGDAVANTGSMNVIEYEYDFRDLLYRMTEGAGSSEELVTQYDYDKNKRLVIRTTNPDSVNGVHQTEEFIYDGHDRLVGIIDPMLNSADFEYDKNHNQTSVKIFGPVDDDTQGADTDVVLYEADYQYDTRDRLTQETVSVFDFMPGSVAQDQVTKYFYNDDSSLRKIESPSGETGVLNTTEYFYDTASRLVHIEDGDSNRIEYQYDLGSNLSRIDQYDFSSTGTGSQQFVTTYTYDSLDRRESAIDGVSNTTQWLYDSRSNMIREIDARLNTTAYDFDGLNRLIATRVRMTADGDGPETDPVLDTLNPELLTTIVYDDSSRVISETDDNGHTTTYGYDAVNRRTSITMPVSGETYLTEYNGNGVASRLTDARGVVLDLTYDANNRLVKREVDTVAGVTPAGSLIEEFTYDGLGRVRTAVNKLSAVLELTKVTRNYDSRGFVLRETQNVDGAGGFPASMDRVVDYEFDLADNTTRILYPHGRDIQRSYDSINRLISIKDHEPLTPMAITEFDYLGDRLEQRIHGNGTQTGYQYSGYLGGLVESGDLGFGKVNTISTSKTGSGEILDAFRFTWDAAQNRTSYKDVGSGMKNRRERLFGYDSSDRLVSTDVDFPDVNSDFTSPTNSGITTYALDGVHNRFSVNGFEEAGAPIGIYKDTATDLPDHVKNNQYTFSPHESGGQWTYAYDENGNMVLKAEYNVADISGDYNLNFQDISAFNAAYAIEDISADINGDGSWNFLDVSAFLTAYGQGGSLDNQHYTYDFRNQLIAIEFKVGSTTVSHTVTNSYDSFARRVTERFDDGNGDVKELQFVYGCTSLWEVIEQIQLAEGATAEKLLTTHVYGLGIDDEVSYRLEDLVVAEDYWAHRDDLNSLTSVTDELGDVKERYEYGDFGKPRMIDPMTGDERLVSSVGVVHLYTGRSIITGTGLVDFRTRALDYESGKFVQRDPLGYIDSLNAYAYVINNPHTFDDPYGLSYWNDFVEGWKNVVDTLDGTLQEEANKHANDITRMTNINVKKARDRGDDCFAMLILKRGYADAAAIMANATGLAEQTEDLIQQLVDEIIYAPIPGPGVPGGGKVVTGLGKNHSNWSPTLKRLKDSAPYIRGKYRAKKGGKQVTRQDLNNSHGKGSNPTRGTTKHDKGNTHGHDRKGQKPQNGVNWHHRTRHNWS